MGVRTGRPHDCGQSPPGGVPSAVDHGGVAPAEALLRGLIEAAPDAILAVDADGRIVFANVQAAKLFGYRRDELVGQPIEVLIPEPARGIHPSHRSKYFSDPRPRPMGAGMQLAGRRQDGTEFPAEISLSALETEKGLLVSAAVRDVTDRLLAQREQDRLRAEAEQERLERQLHQSQRLESLGLLAGGVAHDFNNLLAVILVYASMVEQEVARAAGDDARWVGVGRDVAQIKHAAERATRLTHQLLAFGRREVVQPRALRLNDVVGDVESLLRRTLGEHVELLTSLVPDVAPVMADPGQIEQVLVNLAVNARDAMPLGGTLTIDTENIDIGDEYAGSPDALPPGAYVRLRVSDSGTGMPPEVIEHAFEPFYTTKPKGEGTGLGLSTVYGIVTQAGGYVRIYSEPGLGTSISSYLPRVELEVEPQANVAPPAQAHRGNETILVVEDEPAMREVARRILVRNGYTVLAASGGREAIAIAEAHAGAIDLLVTDVVMPHMLGKDVAERLTAMRPALRVLYMSGYAHPVLASQGTLEPGVTLLEKPFSEQVMLSKVRAALDALPLPLAGQDLVGRSGRQGAFRVALVDDQEMVATTFRRLLEGAGMEVVGIAPTIESGVALVAEQSPDVVVVDYLLPDGLGTDAVPRILAVAPSTLIVMASGSDTLESRDVAMQAGCVAYVDKAAAVHTLVATVRQAATHHARSAGERRTADLQPRQTP